MNPTIGTDSEVQIINNDGKLISAVGLLGGTKEAPRWFGEYNIQEDNINAEFAINPVDNLDDWIDRIEGAMGTLADVVGEKGYSLRIAATGNYDWDQLDSPEAMLFGCDPDFSAYTGFDNPTPDPYAVGNLRSAGGHIHVGTDKDVIELVKWMDVFLGVPSLLMDEDRRRRRLYGMAGSHRIKPYGVEYRALSNFWIRERSSMEWAYNQTIKAVEAVGNMKLSDIPDFDEVPDIIDNYDQKKAESLLNWLSKENV